MRSLVRQAVFIIANTALIAAASGCQAPPAKIHSVKPSQVTHGSQLASQQLIIKFKPNTITCDAAGIARLSVRAQMPLEFVRVMSGDACVIRQLADNPNKFASAQKLLKQDPAVEWVEPDGAMKTQ